MQNQSDLTAIQLAVLLKEACDCLPSGRKNAIRLSIQSDGCVTFVAESVDDLGRTRALTEKIPFSELPEDYPAIFMFGSLTSRLKEALTRKALPAFHP